jgi:hypothetical protein
MRYAYLVLALLFVACNTKQPGDKATSIQENSHQGELDYLKRRDMNLEYFNNKAITDTLYEQMNDSLIVLEKLLRNILSDTKIDSINVKGKINLETLFPHELGYGMLDGLITHNQSLHVFCTTKIIFLDYYKNDPVNKTDDLAPTELEVFFNDAFCGGHASITNLTSYRVVSTNGIQAYGMIGNVAQDIGPYLPNHMYVFVSTDDHIYLIQKPIRHKLHELSICKNAWDSLYRRSRDKYDMYRASNRTDKSSMKEATALEEKAWHDYCECYRKNFQYDKQFPLLKKEIDEMVKLILH